MRRKPLVSFTFRSETIASRCWFRLRLAMLRIAIVIAVGNIGSAAENTEMRRTAALLDRLTVLCQ